MMRAHVALLAAALALPACLGRGDFRCQQHAQCGDSAFCEADGRCSLMDARCPSGRRYLHEAGAAGDLCVGDSCPGNPVRALVAGVTHACALRADGAVWCWGRNDDGQLGDGTHTPRALPVPVPGLAARAVAAGERHTCAVRTDGTAVCWGADDTGQLGDGGGAAQAALVAVPGVTDAVEVAAGAGFSCAVLRDGTARCWGDDSHGQLGDGAPAPGPAAPVTVFALTGVRALSAHWQHACALRDDETLWCWGGNSQGQVGDGTLKDQPRPVRVQPLTAVTDVATGLLHTCAATRAEGLFCWGNNNTGQLGNDTPAPQPRPTLVPIVTDPIGVAAGAQHTCAVRRGGATLCWGNNAAGQLGEGTTTSLPVPVAVTGMAAGAAVAAGGAFSCARTRDAAVFCWGDNHYGTLGIGTATVRPRPQPALRTDGTPVTGAVDIAAGAAHTCALGEDAAISCWGANQAGQLCDNGTIDRSLAAATKVPVDKAAALAAGATHACARTSDGALWCWGRGSAGQLGPGRLVDTPRPTQVLPATAGVVSAAAGDAHTCAALMDGSAQCWGAGAEGQLGDGLAASRPQPAPVATLDGSAPATRVAEIVAGGGHTCARVASGAVLCWGRGSDGQLGDGGTSARPTPVAAPLGGAGAMALAAGAAQSCALDQAGAIWCWGHGASPTPAPIAGVSGALALAAGGAHTCAVQSDGTVTCWGANDQGQLGDGGTGAHDGRASVAGLVDVVQLTAGATHTCARRRDGSVWCWGGNAAGQLGDGVLLARSAPQLTRLACP